MVSHSKLHMLLCRLKIFLSLSLSQLISNIVPDHVCIMSITLASVGDVPAHQSRRTSPRTPDVRGHCPLNSNWSVPKRTDAAISICHKYTVCHMCMCSSLYQHLSSFRTFSSFAFSSITADQICSHYACVRTGGKARFIFISFGAWGAKQGGWWLRLVYFTGIRLMLIHSINKVEKWNQLRNIVWE